MKKVSLSWLFSSPCLAASPGILHILPFVFSVILHKYPLETKINERIISICHEEHNASDVDEAQNKRLYYSLVESFNLWLKAYILNIWHDKGKDKAQGQHAHVLSV